ncbi:MAG: hypothetical protein ACYDCG_15720 [Candidatus Acidiferrales bacterium]
MEKLHWPSVADNLRRSGEDWENEALFSAPLHGFCFYATSYKEAADSVVEAVESGDAKPDLVCYAVFYLYHHFLELMLKGIILLQCQHEGTERPYRKTEHNIDTLWALCRQVLEEVFPEGEKSETDAVERCIKQFASVDRSGELGRYPVTQYGNLSFQKTVQLNLRNLREMMTRLNGFLSASYDALDELNSHVPTDGY